MNPPEEKSCFVLMPFRLREVDRARYISEHHWDEVYEGLIQPAVARAGFLCERDDGDTGSRLISENILMKIERTDLVLCDLSSSNANVFLELGWALRSDKPFVLIKDKLTEYQFDLNQYFTFDYDHTLQPIGLAEDIERLAHVILDTDADRSRRYSIVGKLSLSFSAIEAAFRGDKVSGLLLQIIDKLNTLEVNPVVQGTPSPLSSIWPSLVRRGLSALYKMKTAIEESGLAQPHTDPHAVASIVLQNISSLGIRRQRDIQFSLVDEKRCFIFHDRDMMIGEEAGKVGFENFDIYEEVFRYPCGAVVWSDKGSNIPGRAAYRHNMGLWSTIRHTNWKAVVELHHEIGDIA